ncbi:MAG TPA: BamA/TamA family outer membrane protein [Chitinophagaceae bacterium]|nr:BamA/TamA family outer membrane protein [Chitinophagaceae bacterium]
MFSGKPFFSERTTRVLIAGLVSLSIFSCKLPVIVKKYPPNKPFVFQTNISVNGNFSNEDRDALASRLRGQLDDSLRSRAVSKVLWSVMKNPPAYDSNNVEKSIVFMRALLNSMGYFRDTITYNDTTRVVRGDQYRTTVNFDVWPGKVVTLDSIRYNIENPALQTLTKNSLNESYLKKGEPFAKATISAELDRLVDIYRNNGYMRMSRDELQGVWDTLNMALLNPSLDPFEQVKLLDSIRKSREDPKANLEIRLKPGADPNKQVKYFIGNITVYPDYSADTVDHPRKEVMVDGPRGVNVVYYRYIFKPKVFPPNIYFHRDSLYSQQKYLKTVNRFNALGAWRLTNIEQVPRKDSDTADFNIRLTPARKYSFTISFEGSRNQSLVAGNLLGLAVNTGIQDRNLGKSLNQAITNLRYGIETGRDTVTKVKFTQTRQLSFSHTIYFPRPIPYLRIIPERFKDNFRTLFSFKADLTERRELYNLNTINASWGYEYQWNETASRKKFVSIRLPNIAYSSFTSKPKLDTIFKYNPSLKNIFTDGFISSASAGYTVTDVKNNVFSLFRANFEGSGVLTGALHGKFLDTNLYRFIKVDLEFAWKRQINKSAIAFRVFGGVGYELESTVNENKRNNLPFFKQYFAGGPNSMRAWGVRKLGPGSVVKSFGTTGVPERYGDVQLEANVEYRFPVANLSGVLLNGALFSDIGNVWLLKKKAGAPEEVFNFNRLGKDLAIDIGVGLRIDFNFFVIRFDYAYKVKDPSPDPANAALQNKWFGYKWRDGDKIQLGIGYPFIL